MTANLENYAENTFGFYANQYVIGRAAKGVSIEYVENIRCNLKHLVSLFPMAIANIKASQIQSLLNNLCFNNPNAIYGNTSKRVLHNDRIIFWNPVDAVEIPAGEPKHKRKPLSDKQVQWIIDTPSEMQTSLLIALYCGLRRSEILALTWDDIDFENKTISVSKHASRNGTIVNKTKTESGKREVPIPTLLISYLSQLDHSHQFVAFNTDRPVSANVFCYRMKKYLWLLEEKYGDPALCPCKDIGRNGTPVPKGHVVQGIGDPWFAGFTIDTFTIHQARHSYCTMCFDAGLPERACVARMGHADSQMIHQVYLHLSQEMDQKCRDMFDDYCDTHFLNKKIQI